MSLSLYQTVEAVPDSWLEFEKLKLGHLRKTNPVF
jgi:hypothetical protein